ncbi:methionyl-tRNA formyltransferase [Glycomyces rhizosphaerae]|uniref:Methionyl-tRNA formyltransferase n=1 Tax=Glycomyces rhizosphaerae TaxID=2054422 RepID=A0ABV7Q8W9_9ACTN
MSITGMRVVIVTQYASALRGMVRQCRAKGHTPVAVICTRKEPSRDGAGSPGMKAMAKSIVAACPAGMAVAVVDSRAQLAELVEHYAPDLLLVRGFPWRLPPRVLEVAEHGSVNLHPSELPRHRGPFPVHRAIAEGAERLSVTAHRMDAGFDTGPILATASIDIAADEFGPAIWAGVDRAADQVLALALDRIAAGEKGEPQDDAAATYAGAFDAGEAAVDWRRPVRDVHNLIRTWSLGSIGTPGADGPEVELDGRPVRILRTSLTEIDGPSLPCGDGRLWLAEYQELSRSKSSSDHERDE